MVKSSSLYSLYCKGCSKSIMSVDELLIMSECIRNHGSNHFHIKSIEGLINHYSDECPKFSSTTTSDEAQRLVRVSVNNLFRSFNTDVSIFDVNKEILDYIQYKRHNN